MRFGVLGPVEVCTADGRRVRVRETKVRALLADLLARRGRVTSSDRLIEDLWDADLPARPTGALQTKVAQLRRALEDAEPGGRGLVVSRPPGYVLRTETDAVDADRFTALLGRARATEDATDRSTLLTEALALWRGPAFADVADAVFTRAAIRSLEEERLVALEEQAEARLVLGDHDMLAGELGAQVERHPLRERLRAAHLRALYRAGRQSEALAGYRDLRERLADELGLDPGPRLVALHQAILEQDPALAPPPSSAQAPVVTSPSPGPPDTTWAARGTNLPAPLTELIGRDAAIREAYELLDAGRLVTLTGPGGVGKTRLALAVAERPADTRPDGAWLVELGGHGLPQPSAGRYPHPRPSAVLPGAPTTVAEVAEVVAGVLDVRDDTGTERPPRTRPPDLVQRLAAAVRTRRLLLVLDNCEHLVEPVAELAERLLRAAPGLRILATSREPLGIVGEALYDVPPLDLPGSEPETDPVDLRRSTAVRLFTDRARAADREFALTADNAPAVAAICRRLDGIPLALELAATRVRTLGVHELLARLDDRLELLTGGHRGAPARQRTLRAMIDWSWELLTDVERVVLRRLTVHADGCTLQAAQTVCAGDGVHASEVLDALSRLVDRSLVTVTGAERPGDPRYRLLESVGAYGIERLAQAGELERVRLRHHQHYVDLAERAGARLRGPDQRQWLERLDLETANLRGALDGAARSGTADLAVRLVNALAWYWFLRGRLSEARRSLDLAVSVGADTTARAETSPAARAAAVNWQAGFAALIGDGTGLAERAERALAHYADVDDPAGRAMAEWFSSHALTGAGDLSAHEARVDRALAGFRAAGHRWGEAAALTGRAAQARLRGDLTAAAHDGERSATLFADLGDGWGRLKAGDGLASLAEINGDYQRAARLHRDGLRIAEDLGLWTEVSYKLSGLGRIALLTGDHERADDLHRRAMRRAAERSHLRGVQFAEVGLGLGARRRDDLDAAETHLRTWLDWCRRVDGDPGVALILAELGFVAEQRGDAETALALHADGFAAARSTGDPRALALALEGLAGARALAGHREHAARLLGAATAARDSTAPLPAAERGDVDRITAAVRTALDEQTFAAEFARGSRLPPEAAYRITRPE